MRSTILAFLFLALLADASVAAYDATMEEDIAILDIAEASEDYGASFDLMAVSSSAQAAVADTYVIYEQTCSNTTLIKCLTGNKSGKIFTVKKDGVTVTSLPSFAIGSTVKFQAGQDMWLGSVGFNGQTLSGFIICENKGAETCGAPNNTVSQTNLARTAADVLSAPLTYINQKFQVQIPASGKYCFGDRTSPYMGLCYTGAAFSSAVVSAASVLAVLVATLMVAL